ncbi:MAG: SLC13 family permease [Lactococcus hircilactis]
MVNTLKRIGSDKTFLVTFLLAVLSLMFGTVKVSDIDIKTVLALLSLIITVSIYENLNLLKHVADLIIEKCGTMRSMVFVILLFSFFGSMLFTNDVAILTLVPILFSIDQKIKIPKISIISLTTIYANLGSALTPIGNPQNLYLVSHYHLSLLKFFQMSLPIGCLSLISLVLCPFFSQKRALNSSKVSRYFFQKKSGLLLALRQL